MRYHLLNCQTPFFCASTDILGYYRWGDLVHVHVEPKKGLGGGMEALMLLGAFALLYVQDFAENLL